MFVLYENKIASCESARFSEKNSRITKHTITP